VHDPLRRPWTEPGRDPELTRAAQRGDVGALHTLLRNHRRELWRACFTLTLDRLRAERLLHETLLRAAKNLRSVPEGAAILPWLVRLAAHLATSLDRRDGPTDAAAGRVQALGTVLDDEQSRAFEAFAALPAADRLLLSLAVLEGLSYAEIAAITRREPNAVLHQLSVLRARIAGEEAA
jgi:DNA-directed RNA polymerase specialized sigma24 family protein